MIPHYLVDGYNVIHKIPELKSAMEESLERARNLLIHRILNYQSRKKIAVTLVFDGADVGVIPDPFERKKNFRVYYSHSPEKADPLIKKLIQEHGRSNHFILVSDDRELIDFAKYSGAEVMSPIRFFSLLRKEKRFELLNNKFDSNMSQDELKNWLKLFGEGEE